MIKRNLKQIMRNLRRRLRELLFGFGLIILAGNAKARENVPNLIIIVVDALRPDHLSCNGYAWEISPNIDRIAKTGVTFKDATTTIPLTNPALATFFTSQPISRTGVNRNGIPLLPGNQTLAEILKQEGYHTFAVVSCWATYHKRSGLEAGFNRYLDSGTSILLELDAEIITRRALKLVEREIEEPFFLFVGYSEPHQPHFWYPSLSILKTNPEPDKRSQLVKNYDSEVAYTDYWIGVLLSRLEERGWLKNSLLVIMSDHGESLGEKNYVGHGRALYEQILRITLILSGPDLPRGKQIQSPVYMLDIMPTILSYLNLAPSQELTGRNLLEHILHDHPLPPIPMYYETNSIAVPDLPGLKKIGRASLPSMIGLRIGHHKILYSLKEKRWEIYDLSADPEEKYNLFNPEEKNHRLLMEQLLENFRTKSSAQKGVKLELIP